MYTENDFKKVDISDVKIRANKYQISGNLVNGGQRNENGEWIPFICKENITRPISYIDLAKKRLYCVCGREFIIDDDLILIECPY